MTTQTNYDNINKVYGDLDSLGFKGTLRSKVLDYLRTRTGLALMPEDADSYKEDRKLFIYCRALTQEQLGAFRFIINTCNPTIAFTGGTPTHLRDVFHVRIRFQYTHPKGGSNSCGFNWHLVVNKRTGEMVEENY